MHSISEDTVRKFLNLLHILKCMRMTPLVMRLAQSLGCLRSQHIQVSDRLAYLQWQVERGTRALHVLQNEFPPQSAKIKAINQYMARHKTEIAELESDLSEILNLEEEALTLWLQSGPPISGSLIREPEFCRRMTCL